MGSYSKAINAYETQINIDPITPMPWVGLGDTYIDLEQYSKAKKSYLNAINIDKNICEAWVGLGKVEIKLNHYASAIESLTRSTDIDENHGSAWYFKGVAYRMLSNYSESYNCYYKSSNLLSRVKSYKNRMIIVNLIKDIDENYEAPLLLKQIFELNQWLLNRYIYSKIYVSSVNICKHYLNLIEYISSDNFKRNKSDKLVLIGLIYYYMADYDSAYEIFDAVDSENEANLMGQYYLLSTLNRKMKLREYDSVLKYAFTTISNNVDNGLFENLQQKYYLGLLYNLIDKNSEALEVFKNINDFIPATFMSLLCAHKLKNKPGIKNLIEEVYDSDASYFKKTKNSFILGVQKTAIDILDEYWDEPFKMYANSIEISEAIVLVHKFIDDYEKKYKVVPKKMKYIDKGYRIEIDQGQLPFTLLDSTINKLEIFKREQINEHVLSLEKELVNIFDEIPLMDEHKTKLIDDEELAYIIENDNNNKSDKYKKLILFYYLRGNLSSKKTLILIFYLYLLDFRKNKKISGILMMSIERALSSFIISYTMSTFFESQIYSALLTSFGAAFIPLFHGYLKKLESEKIEQITYKELRDGFVSHVSYLIARNNVKFMKIYEFDDVDMWMNK